MIYINKLTNLVFTEKKMDLQTLMPMNITFPRQHFLKQENILEVGFPWNSLLEEIVVSNLGDNTWNSFIKHAFLWCG